MSWLPPPNIQIEVLEKTFSSGNFLEILHSKIRARYPDGKTSEPFLFDSVLRAQQDAVVILGHFLTTSQGLVERHVYLRSCLRPSLELRNYLPSGITEVKGISNLYELPAGLVELNETGWEGLHQAAAREFQEEIGYSLDPKQFHLLGPRVFSAAGISANRIFFFEVEIPSSINRAEPSLDGSPLEMGGAVISIPISEALKYINTGYLPDLKTELGLNRLANRYGITYE